MLQTIQPQFDHFHRIFKVMFHFTAGILQTHRHYPKQATNPSVNELVQNQKTASTKAIIEHMSENLNVSVAVLLPCYNEEVTIGKVVRDFKTALPNADIYVYDNNSTDRTAEIATAGGRSFARNHAKARAT